MGLWPFGGRKKARNQSDDIGNDNLLEKKLDYSADLQTHSSSQNSTSMARSDSQNEKPRRLSKQRLPSKTTTVSRTQTAPVNIPGTDAGGFRRNKSMNTPGSDVYSHNPLSQSSLGPDDFTALPQAPTLLAKRPGFDPTLHRKKSSKRKAEDYAREREVRAMSSSTQSLRRPLTYGGPTPLRRETKEIPGNLNRRLQRPLSEVSLPLPATIQDAEDDSNASSFKIGFLAALSPRPTLTYIADPRTSFGKQPSRLKPSIQQAIEEEAPTSKKRINELADELDASGLRELMERDRRRKEKKKEVDRARLERRLQRKADRQQEEELRGRQMINPAANLMDFSPGGRPVDKDPFSDDDDEIPSSPAAAAGESSRTSHAPSDPFIDPQSSKRPSQAIRNPFEDEKDIDLMQDPLTPGEDEDPPIPIRSPLRTATEHKTVDEVDKPMIAAQSPPTSPVQAPSDRPSMSQLSALAREQTPEVPEWASQDRRPSDNSGQQLNSWTSFFKKGGRRKPSVNARGRSTPSEFSNTSRESFVRKQQVPPVTVPRTFRRSDASSVPRRTMSKFREDLPELPISPPDSRVQSPEAATSPQADLMSRHPRHSLSGTLDNRSLATSSSNQALDRATAGSRQSQNLELDPSGGPSAALLSQSLASVDSEGSWLSGKPSKRLSGGASHTLRQSQSSIPPQSIPGSYEPEADDLANDEYLSRLTPGPSGRRDSVISADRRASSNIIDLERERQQSPVPDVPPLPGTRDETWHSAPLGRQPTVIRQATRAKSKEGLLNEADKDTPGAFRRASLDDTDDDLEGETPGVEIHDAPLLRASSVDYKTKGHVRHISAGSARLLDIRRSSMQSDGAPRTPISPTFTPSSLQRERQPTPKTEGS
jgi:hypothetical protein